MVHVDTQRPLTNEFLRHEAERKKFWYHEELDRLRLTADALERQLEEAEKRLTEISNELADIKTKADDVRAAIQNLTDKYEERRSLLWNEAGVLEQEKATLEQETKQLRQEIENQERQSEALQRLIDVTDRDSCAVDAPYVKLAVAAGNWSIDELVITIEGFTEHGWRFLGHIGVGLQMARFGGPSFMWRLHALNNSNSTFIVQSLVMDNAGNSYLVINETQHVKLAPQSNDTIAHWLIEGWE